MGESVFLPYYCLLAAAALLLLSLLRTSSKQLVPSTAGALVNMSSFEGNFVSRSDSNDKGGDALSISFLALEFRSVGWT